MSEPSKESTRCVLELFGDGGTIRLRDAAIIDAALKRERNRAFEECYDICYEAMPEVSLTHDDEIKSNALGHACAKIRATKEAE